MASSKPAPPPGSVTTDAIPDGDRFKADILAARRTPPEQRVMDGLRLFEMASQILRAGLQSRHPNADDGEIDRLFAAQLDRQRRTDEQGIYTFRLMTPEEAGL